ncbi:MAG: rod shape-determining protein MreD [Candidatus Omnitrophica bacterium]|nr:rod shape-determining protein MreD [Candidatus Omnitrophota bacterium]
MKRIAVIALVSYLAFVLEFVLFNAFGSWGKPEFLILVVIFFNLYLGIRFSIIAAVFCGLLKDASGIAPLGTYILVYVTAAYVTTLVRRYLYQKGSRFSRGLVAFLVIIVCFIVQAILVSANRQVRFSQLFLGLLVPQVLTTMIVATFVFQKLRDISVFFSLKS